MTDVVLLRFAEIFLKGQNRPFFERKLVSAVARAMHGISGARVQKTHARVVVELPADARVRAVARLQRVFGVQSLSPARVVDRDLDAISAEAVRATQDALARRGGGHPTFKVVSRRRDKTFPMTSVDVSRLVGAAIVKATGLPVDVHDQQLEIGIEISERRTFVYADVLPGPGGLPVGATGKVNLLLSGGIDSPVAGWLAAKRGCTLTATYFHAFPYTGDKTKEKVVDLVKLLAEWHGPIDLHVIQFATVQKLLRDAGPGELAVVLYRRMMMRAACAIARRDRAQALVTGENLAQVASQTLENLAVIEDASELPVLRPLLTNDKLETIALARRIGTYETSILPYEDCCSLFVPAHPATKARLADVEEVEAKLDIAALTAGLVADAERIAVR
jgi:thiamine biosynthesis protein ThiI